MPFAGGYSRTIWTGELPSMMRAASCWVSYSACPHRTIGGPDRVPPGTNPPPQTPAEIKNTALKDVITSIAGQSTGTFNDLLQVIDETLWMVDPLGGRKDQMLSALIGRPLAVVQAHSYNCDSTVIRTSVTYGIRCSHTKRRTNKRKTSAPSWTWRSRCGWEVLNYGMTD